MELIGFNNSRITALCWASSVSGQPYLPKLLQAAVERYGFVGFPSKVDDLLNERMSFRHGTFDNAAIETFDIYSDGVVATSKSNTMVLDAFLGDIFAWAEHEFGFKMVKTHQINKMYESDLIIQSDINLLRHWDALKPVQSLISRHLKDATGLDTEYFPFGLAIAADNASIAGMKPVGFRLERKIELARARNFYVSSAPLRTNDHLEVLEALEAIAASTPSAKDRRQK